MTIHSNLMIENSLSPLSPLSLDWKDRSQEINKRIDKIFEDIKKDNLSRWFYNGEKEYRLLDINEHKFVKTLIEDAPISKKEFFILDIGAGDFQWGRQFAHYLNKKRNLPADIEVHIYSLRGESGTALEEKRGICTIHELVSFKIENLSAEFEQRNLCLENKIDFIVSRWCFRHLVDPLGTFVQTYNLLAAETGFLLMDGFFFSDDKDTRPILSRDYRGNMIDLLVHTKAPFLLQYFDVQGSTDRFLMRRLESTPCQIDATYKHLQKVSKFHAESKFITHFDLRWEKRGKGHFELNYLYQAIFGDCSLFDWINNRNLFEQEKFLVPLSLKK